MEYKNNTKTYFYLERYMSVIKDKDDSRCLKQGIFNFMMAGTPFHILYNRNI